MRTRFDDDGATFSLYDIAARTHGRISVDELTALVEQGPLAQPDAVTCVLLAQAFDVDPDYFVTDDAVNAYIARILADYSALDLASGATPTPNLQLRAHRVATRDAETVAAR